MRLALALWPRELGRLRFLDAPCPASDLLIPDTFSTCSIGVLSSWTSNEEER